MIRNVWLQKCKAINWTKILLNYSADLSNYNILNLYKDVVFDGIQRSQFF